MAYECPKCGGPVHRNTNSRAGGGGIVGALLVAAFGKFQCPKCGPIAKSDFPPEVHGQMTRNSMIMVIVALAVLVGVIALIVALQ